jgi:hypothetical protein
VRRAQRNDPGTLGLALNSPRGLGVPGCDGRVAHPHGLPCRHEIAFTCFAPSLMSPRAVSDGRASAWPPHTSVGLSLRGPPPFLWTYHVRAADGCLAMALSRFVTLLGAADSDRGDDFVEVPTRQAIPAGTHPRLADVDHGRDLC